jgi:hypothetical protein
VAVPLPGLTQNINVSFTVRYVTERHRTPTSECSIKSTLTVAQG